MKTLTFTLASIFFIVISSVKVMGHCHDSIPCEQPMDDLISTERWDEPHNNKVRYFVNNTSLPNFPSFFPDITIASGKWSKIRFNNQTTRFSLQYAGSTTLHPAREDGMNVVGWEAPSRWDSVGEMYTWYDYEGSRWITEQDLLFNYYLDWERHPAPTSGHWCIMEVATHEFGHWVRLLDVGNPSLGQDCQEYEYYTMYYKGLPNEHVRETLNCEDKWGAWYTYNSMPWPPVGSAPIAQRPPPPVNESRIGLQTRLLQNYPDPFNPETWIPYELAEDSDVSLEIYDSSGMSVRKFDLGLQQRGSYVASSKALHWDGTNNQSETVSSGVYFYTLRADGFSETKRLVIVK